MSSAAKNTIAI